MMLLYSIMLREEVSLMRRIIQYRNIENTKSTKHENILILDFRFLRCFYPLFLPRPATKTHCWSFFICPLKLISDFLEDLSWVPYAYICFCLHSHLLI